MTVRRAFGMAALVVLLFLSGCSSKSNPAAPVATTPDPNGDPPIPKPTSASVDAPLESEVYTVIKPLGTAFGPEVSSVHGNFQDEARLCVYVPGIVDCCSSWNTLGSWTNTWSDQLPAVTSTYSGCTGFPPTPLEVSAALGSLGHRWLTFPDGSLEPPTTLPVAESRPDGSFTVDVTSVVTFPQISGKPYLRRDRQWVREPLTDGSNSFILTGNTSADFETSRTNGINVTDSRAFAETISGSTGLSAAGITASVQQAVTNTFSTSTTIQQETTTTYTYSVSGTDGKVTVFNVWALVDTYTITDAEGNVFADPAYHFAPIGPVAVRGLKHWLDTTKFDQ